MIEFRVTIAGVSDVSGLRKSVTRKNRQDGMERRSGMVRRPAAFGKEQRVRLEDVEGTRNRREALGSACRSLGRRQGFASFHPSRPEWIGRVDG